MPRSGDRGNWGIRGEFSSTEPWGFDNEDYMERGAGNLRAFCRVYISRWAGWRTIWRPPTPQAQLDAIIEAYNDEYGRG